MSEPLVSIISPTYNHEKYIDDCIRSALNQTFSDWEMLVIDDGSTDHTFEIVKQHAAKDNRIVAFHQKNVGILRLSETYNFALRKARGKYIAILEGDDVWYPDKLKRQVEVFENNNRCILSWGAAHQANADLSHILLKSPLATDPMSQYFSNEPVGSILNILFFRNCIPALTMLIRKDVLLDSGGFLQGYGLPLVDLPTLQKLATCGPFHFDSEPLGSWRVYPGQTTKTYLTQMFEGFYSLTIENYKNYSQNSSLSFNVTMDQIKKHFNNTLVIAYSRSGRYKLIRKQFKQSRQDYLKSLRLPGDAYLWRLRSIVGLIFGLFHLDIETLARILGRPSYKN